jgi:hypothetical protein
MSMPGLRCIASSNSAFSVFRGVRHTASCVCWHGKTPGIGCRQHGIQTRVIQYRRTGFFIGLLSRGPRKHHLVRTAYELNDEPSAYGDHGIRIYGIWSPKTPGIGCRQHGIQTRVIQYRRTGFFIGLLSRGLACLHHETGRRTGSA